jgi:hypothetical protein
VSWAPIAAIARAEVRRRWRALLLLGLLAGCVGAAAVGSVALARRTTTAYERLSTATRVDDARGTVLVHDDLVRDITSLPAVTERWTGRIGVAQIEGEFTFLGITAGPEAPSELFRPVVLEGRMPRAAEPGVIEVALREDFQDAFDIAMGTEVAVRFLTLADYFRFDTGFQGGSPHGPRLTIRVVGTIRMAGGSTTLPPAFAGPDALDAHPDAFEPGAAWFVRLSDGERDYVRFAEQVDELASGRTLPPEAQEFVVAGTSNTSQAGTSVQHSADLLGRALLAVAGAVGLAGIVALGQGFTRLHAAGAEDRQVETALGMTRGARGAAVVLAGLAPAALAVGITVGGATWASRLDPIGAIERYEPSPGTARNLLVVVAGTAATALVVLGLCAATSLVTRRRRAGRLPRESSTVARVARLGGSPPGVTGLRFVLEPGAGARAVPVRSAMTGAIVGIAGVVAGMTFTSSLDRLLDSPSRSAVPYDVLVSDVVPAEVEDILEEGDDIDALVTVASAPVLLAGDRTVDGHALTPERGALDVDLGTGRLPRTPDEIVLGLRIAGDLGVSPGDTVEATGRDGTPRPMAVVGVGVVPTFNGESLGSNALLTPEGMARVGRADTFVSAAVTARPGTDPDALVERLASEYEAGPPELPAQVADLSQFGRLPSLVAALVGTIALVALVNALVALVRRRRRDLAMLRTFGFTRRQAGTTVVVMAVTIVAVGLLVGAPVGAAVGSAIWRTTAAGAYVSSDAHVRWLGVAAVAVAALVAGFVAAMVPALRASRAAPAELLRTE